MTLVSVQGFAQIQRTAEFDFSNPLGLNPAITPPSGNNAEINITDKTFTNKDITIDFDLGNQGLGSTIYHLPISGLVFLLITSEFANKRI